ncbi:ABC-2 type transport system ATP-binding protein [Dyadobacter soli]|uniref:ABC-2 type transport system ATP-binding protein n=1 Tax=Dyadobacter soli TaxID=659014 RepID=A0A1G7EAI6_9BACT|nr:ATP-binding cassette domain-containing protein [Dyadobacter soli]SDE60663.1 ABC-2 type transport system ATP-binding protein [Dyadobacter soli]
MTSHIVQTDRLSYSYGDRPVLHEVSLQVPTGSVFGFLGPNGSGKTTTIRLLLGLIHARGHRIKLFGHEIRRHRLPILRRVGALIETPTLYPHLSGWQNLEIGRLARNAKRGQVEKVLEMVGLTRDASRKVSSYSLGMRQRLGIALALLGDPELLILDEPTNGLDPGGIREIRTLLVGLSQSYGKTILISSHLLAEMEKMVTHVAIINAGYLLFQGSIDHLRADQHDRMSDISNDPSYAIPTLEDIFLNLTNPLI